MTIRLGASPTKINEKGERGSPYLKSLLAGKKLLGIPLIMIENNGRGDSPLSALSNICRNRFCASYKEETPNQPFHRLSQDPAYIELQGSKPSSPMP